MKAITGGIGWEKAGKFSGAGSLESRPREQEREVKSWKRALKAETGP